MAKKDTITFDTQAVLKEFTAKSEALVNGFLQMIATIAPNKIDINKIKSATVAGKSLRDYEKTGVVLINPNGPRSVKIECIDGTVAAKIYKSTTTSLMEAGFQVVDSGNFLMINMQPMTEEIRKDMVKQVKTMKENAKQQVNNLRGDFQKAIKNSNLSEDLLNNVKADIDKITDKMQKQLDTECANKENSILKG